ncbi:polyvinylalcohol dehydrogenase [Planctomycetales bacterium]|nr:polyvinylalcohol dehydrogenase [Planctomycetales bacterium]
MKQFFLFCTLTLFAASVFAADWKQWRGPRHDGVCTEAGLFEKWDGGSPKLLWKVNTLGGGYSNFSFAENKMFSLGDREDGCYLFALNPADGKEIWKLKVGKTGGSRGNNFAGPRSTPVTDGEHVFVLGQFGDLVCAEITTGKELWHINVIEKFDARIMLNEAGIHWDYAISPIIDGNRVLLPIGGKDGTVIAFERTGKEFKLLWQSKEITDRASYASVVPVTTGGVHQYLVFTEKRLAGLDAETGKALWIADRPGLIAICSDPAFYVDGETLYVIVSSFYGGGTQLYKVSSADSQFSVEQIFNDPKIQNHHGGIVQVGGYFYLTSNRELLCLDPKTGKTLWKNRCVGKGSILGLNGKLIVRGESGEGEIALVEASSEEYKEISRFEQPERSDKNSWTYPAVYEGKMYIRDQGLLLCYEVK